MQQDKDFMAHWSFIPGNRSNVSTLWKALGRRYSGLGDWLTNQSVSVKVLSQLWGNWDGWLDNVNVMSPFFVLIRPDAVLRINCCLFVKLCNKCQHFHPIVALPVLWKKSNLPFNSHFIHMTNALMHKTVKYYRSTLLYSAICNNGLTWSSFMTTSTLIILCCSVLSCLLVSVKLPALRGGAVSLEDNCKPGLKNQKATQKRDFHALWSCM